MQITPINNYSKYSNLRPANNKVSFGAIQDDQTSQLMQSMGINPKDPKYQIPQFTLYSEDGKLKGKVTLPKHLMKESAYITYLELEAECVEKTLKKHDGVFTRKDLVDAYFKMFREFFYDTGSGGSGDSSRADTGREISAMLESRP